MLKKIFISFIALLWVFFYSPKAFAVNITYLVDTPTYSLLDYGSYDMQFRIFSRGGVLTKLNFGIFSVLNFGVSWELENLIGVEDVVVAVPALQLKLNIYSGSEKIPGFAIGYDGQGFFYNQRENKFTQEGKGIYFVLGKELLLPYLNFNGGLNLNDFRHPCILGFVGISYQIIIDTLMVMIEYDNVGKGRDARLNAGLRFWITEGLDIDFIIRNFTISDKESYGCERLLKISYQSRF